MCWAFHKCRRTVTIFCSETQAQAGKPWRSYQVTLNYIHPDPTKMHMYDNTIGSTGDSLAHNNMPSYITLYWCKKNPKKG